MAHNTHTYFNRNQAANTFNDTQTNMSNMRQSFMHNPIEESKGWRADISQRKTGTDFILD